MTSILDSDLDSQAPFYSTRDYVYEGLWENYHKPTSQRLTWTLQNYKSLYVLAFFSALVGFTQSRSWIIARHIVWKRKKAIRLKEEFSQDPLEYLSQTVAIGNVVPWIGYQATRLWRRFRAHPDSLLNHDSPVISPTFGIAAILNVGIFLVLGVALPFYLTEGALGVAVVKSRTTARCGALHWNSPANLARFDFMQRARVDSAFQPCGNRIKRGCEDEHYIQSPKITKRRPQGCLFSGNICHNTTLSFEITHWNITAYELGINSKSSVSMNHRVTCAPLNLDSFLVRDPGPRPLTNISVGNDVDVGKSSLNPTHSMTLHNATNRRSIENIKFNDSRSVPFAYYDSGPYDLTVLPKITEMSFEHRADPLYGIEFGVSTRTQLMPTMHQDLRREDGSSFLVIHRAGSSRYGVPIDDPFFAAHVHISGSDFHFYFPDFEATALGCLEQFQYCMSTDGYCSRWGPLEQVIELQKQLEERNENSVPMELWIFEMSTFQLSVHGYLAVRNKGERGVPLTHSKPWLGSLSYPPIFPDTKEQWITEVETWFIKGILTTILFNQQGLRYYLYFTGDVEYNRQHQQDYTLCDRILFRDVNYTNIDFIGCVMTTITFIILCISSFAVKWLDERLAKLITSLCEAGISTLKYLATAKYRVQQFLIVIFRSSGSKCQKSLSRNGHKTLGNWCAKQLRFPGRHQSGLQLSDFNDTESAIDSRHAGGQAAR